MKGAYSTFADYDPLLFPTSMERLSGETSIFSDFGPMISCFRLAFQELHVRHC
jgi:hypothetical protein